MTPISKEVRQAVRRLLRTPTFTLAAVATLALGIGATASIFAVVHRVVLRPLPYPSSDAIVELDHGAISLKIPRGMGLTPGLYFHYAERSRTLAAVAVFTGEDRTLASSGEPERIRIARVTPSLMSVLRVPPATGRWFSEDEGRPGAARVAVLSHGLWMRRFGSSPGVVGQSARIDGDIVEIVGVMPPSFAFPEARTDLWMAEQPSRSAGFGLWTYAGVGRLRDGVTLADAQAEVSRLIDDLPAAFPGDSFAAGNTQTQLFANLRTLKEARVGGVAGALWFALAAVILVLLVACANVANLFLVRSELRRSEVAVRRALGAGRASIARYFLAESFVLSSLAGILGLALAAGALRLLIAWAPASLPRRAEIQLDGTVVLFTAGLAVAAAVVFGLLPVARRSVLVASVNEMGRGNLGSRRGRAVRHALMGTQLALALVLLVSSALLVRSFQKLRATDPGFDTRSALTFSIGLPEREYPTGPRAVAAHRAILDGLATLPGVTVASATSCLPLEGTCFGNTVLVEGRARTPGTAPPLAVFRAVAPRYFEAMGMTVRRGRTLTRDDEENARQVVAVNDTFARTFFGDEDPIGKRVASNRPAPRPAGSNAPAAPQGERKDLTWLEVVGVVADTPVTALGEQRALPQLYMPLSISRGPETPIIALVGAEVSTLRYVVRTTTSPSAVVPAVRRAVDEVDPTLAIASVASLEDIIARATAQAAFTMTLLALAALVTLVLGTIGVYGVMSYIVTQRTAEIGVRVALGAQPRGIAVLIVRQGGIVAVVGAIVGLAAALASGRLIEPQLYGVSPHDWTILAGTTLLLLTVAVLACWVPARRAAAMNPIDALRDQ